MSDAETRTALDARYGRSPDMRRRDRIIAIAFGMVVAAVVIAWALWATADQTGTSIEVLDVAHTIHDGHSVDVVFDVSVAANTPVTCAVQALNESFSIVGWTIVDFGPEFSFTTRHFVNVLTSEQATTGLVYRCWIA